MSSLTRQLAEQTDSLPLEVKKFHDENAERNRDPTEEERLSLVRAISCSFNKTYIFIDALVIFLFHLVTTGNFPNT
jgi:hypothetical protein